MSEQSSYRDCNNIEHLRDPRWAGAGRVHEWRNYVGERTRVLWATFTDDQLLALAADADERAGSEDWD